MQNADSHHQPSRSALACPHLHGDNDFTEELENLAQSDLSEDEETRVRCLEELRSRLREEPGLCWQDDDLFLLAFLRARKFSVDRALSLVKGLYGFIGKHSHVYYAVDRERVAFLLAQNCLYVLPQRDRDNCTVAIFRTPAWDLKLVSVELLYGVCIMCLFHVLRHHSAQIAGLKLIVDYETFGFKHLTYVRPWHVWLFGEMLQNCFPYRMRGFHVMNGNKFFQSIWMILRQFLSKKLTERVHFHGKNAKTLHQFVDPKILPAEYGGEQPHFDNSDMRQIMDASAAYTDYVLSFGYDKYLRGLAPKSQR